MCVNVIEGVGRTCRAGRMPKWEDDFGLTLQQIKSHQQSKAPSIHSHHRVIFQGASPIPLIKTSVVPRGPFWSTFYD